MFVFFLNAVICREIFHTGYVRFRDSIEGAYIGISRILLEHPGTLGWFQQWYCGIPFQNTYPPLFHVLAALWAWVSGTSTAVAHHAVGGFFYCLGPAGLFLLARALSRNTGASFGAALLFSLISPSVFLMPLIRQDVGSLFHARRLQALVRYGEGPHVAAIALALIATIALHYAIERGTPGRIVAAALAFAAVFSTNWLGSAFLFLCCLSYILARSFDRRLWRMLSIFGVAAALGYGFVLPWIPPSTMAAVRRNAQYNIGYYPMGPAQAVYGALLIGALLLFKWMLEKRRASLGLRFAVYLLVLTAGITLPADRFPVYVLPQPVRYHLEMELAIALVLGIGIGPAIVRALGRQYVWAIAVLAILGAIQFRTTRRYARRILTPIDIHQTIEYQAATWLRQHRPGRRVFAAGSTEFWLTAFSDNPEVGGGFGQGVIDPEVPALSYGIPYTSGDGANSAMWLRVLGAQVLLVSEANGRDAYNYDWHDPGKFRGVLPELWRQGGDVVYAVPSRSDALAHVVRAEDVVRRPPPNVLDMAQARKLDADMQDPSLPIADFRWIDPSTAEASANAGRGQVFFFQISYHPGWHAVVNGKSAAIQRDGLGFMVVEPNCNGACRIRLAYDGGTEMRLARAGQATAFTIAPVWWLYGFRKRKEPRRVKGE